MIISSEAIVSLLALQTVLFYREAAWLYARSISLFVYQERCRLDSACLIFIHGLMGSSQGEKAVLLRRELPGILTPDFSGSLEERMAQLEAILEERAGWTIIGSSLGGLMAALYAARHPQRVARLVLLAPALVWPDFAASPSASIPVPAVVYHGTRDEIVPLEAVRRLCERVFTNLDFHAVDDDHGLYDTVHQIDWPSLVAGGQ